MRFVEHRTTARGLPDLLLYDSLPEDGILLLHDGSLLSGWKFRGPDMDSATHLEMAALSARLNSIMRLGSGWMIEANAIRSSSPEYPEPTNFPDPVSLLIDIERHEQFRTVKGHYETEYFLTLCYQPPRLREEKIKGWIFDEQGEADKGVAARALETFRQRLRSFEDILSSLVYVDRLNAQSRVDVAGFPMVYDELLEYVHRCITGKVHPIVLPDIPTCLADTLGSEDFVAGMEPRIGGKHIRVVAIDGFPRVSRPGMLRQLDALPFEYRWNTRAILLDPEQAGSMLDKHRRKWKSRVRGWKDQLMKTESGPINAHALEMAADAEDAMGAASAGDVHFCIFTSVMVILGETAAEATRSAHLAVKTISNLGFSCRVENVNAVEAWRGSLPGDGYSNVRRVLLNTMNLADMLPMTAVWAGNRYNPSPLMPQGAPSLLYAATGGGTPFRFNLHVGDVGHTLMVGPPGAGKSTFLGFAAAQWFRYPKARVFAFDKGYSLQVLTHACGGEFYDIGEGTGLAFCPLRDLETPSDIAWAVDWLEALCVLVNHTVTPANRTALSNAVNTLAGAPKHNRTLTELTANVQDEQLRQLLSYYCLGGPIGFLLDSSEDCLGSGDFLTFETEHLLAMNEKAVVPVLLYLFRQIEKRLDGSPTLVPLDEAWIFLRNPLFRERVREWLKTLRKWNATVLLATQNLSDIFNSPIRDVVLESCPTKILLPNPEAGNPASREFYEKVGLNDRELSIVQKSFAKRDYYVVSPEGRRLIGLGLGNVALSFVGVSSKEQRQSVLDLRRQHGEEWIAAWLRKRNLKDWAEFYEEGETHARLVTERGELVEV
jgi:type IV secretion system protein TrbE